MHVSHAIEEVLQRVMPPKFNERRAELMKRFDEAVRELKDRAVMVYGEIVLHEIEVLFMDGFPREKCLTPAYNNTALRKKSIQEEMITEMARLQSELRKGLQRIIEDLEDYGE